MVLNQRQAYKAVMLYKIRLSSLQICLIKMIDIFLLSIFLKFLLSNQLKIVIYPLYFVSKLDFIYFRINAIELTSLLTALLKLERLD